VLGSVVLGIVMSVKAASVIHQHRGYDRPLFACSPSERRSWRLSIYVALGAIQLSKASPTTCLRSRCPDAQPMWRGTPPCSLALMLVRVG
jgi:hypothetical protein